MLKITEAGSWPFVAMRPAGPVPPGTWCVTLGHPLGLQPGRPPVVRVGRVLQMRDGMIQTDCPIVAGDSGGPMVDLDGKVMGINSRINVPQMNMNFHVPIDAFHQSWEQLVKGEVIENRVPGRDSNELRGAFTSVVTEAGRCVVRVRCEDRNVALGTIVGPDGWILTKASQLKGRIVCRTADGKDYDARLEGVNDALDLAMLKIDATGLPALPWSTDAAPDVGRWVASVGAAADRPMAVGVVGVPPRKIPPIYGMLGVNLSDIETPAQIVRISPGSGAEKAGLHEKDIITHVNGIVTATRSELQATLKQYRSGTTVKVTFKRGDQTMDVPATLSLVENPGHPSARPAESGRGRSQPPPRRLSQGPAARHRARAGRLRGPAGGLKRPRRRPEHRPRRPHRDLRPARGRGSGPDVRVDVGTHGPEAAGQDRAETGSQTGAQASGQARSEAGVQVGTEGGGKAGSEGRGEARSEVGAQDGAETRPEGRAQAGVKTPAETRSQAGRSRQEAGALGRRSEWVAGLR